MVVSGRRRGLREGGFMHGKKRTSAAVVTESAAQAALRRGPARELAPDEEKLMRMRLGASLPRGAVLERIALATDSEIEVLAYEIEAYLQLKSAAQARAPAVATPATGSSRAKEKIVRALRKKT
jgi:hypothetical protein